MAENELRTHKSKAADALPGEPIPATESPVLFDRQFREHSNKQFYLNESNKPDIFNINYSNIRFTDANGFGVTFNNCNFAYCIFERAYFRKARFNNCSFVGSLFINCVLRSSTFESCNLSYVRFKDSLISVDSVIRSLPLEPSIRRELLQNLRINARSIGDEKGVKTFIREELCAEREHYRKAREMKEDYYVKKYKGIVNWIKVRVNSLLLWLDYHFWGHGEYPANLVRFILGLLVLLSLIVLLSSDQLNGSISIQQLPGLLLKSCEATAYTFLGINKSSDIEVGLFLTILLILIRYVTFGLFVGMLFRSFSKR